MSFDATTASPMDFDSVARCVLLLVSCASLGDCAFAGQACLGFNRADAVESPEHHCSMTMSTA
jgi:hypothetical protein